MKSALVPKYFGEIFEISFQISNSHVILTSVPNEFGTRSQIFRRNFWNFDPNFKFKCGFECRFQWFRHSFPNIFTKIQSKVEFELNGDPILKPIQPNFRTNSTDITISKQSRRLKVKSLWNCYQIQISTRFQILIWFFEFWTNFRLWRFRVFLRKSNPTILLCSQNNPPPLFLENSEIGECPAKIISNTPKRLRHALQNCFC